MKKKLKNKIMFISDVHMGTNEVWNWYQKKLHQDYVLAMLKHAWQKDVNDVVLLGDFVDLWTTPPLESLPTFEEVVKANQDVFKELIDCANKIKGDVHYFNGNHDMAVSQEDIASIPKILNIHSDKSIKYGGDSNYKVGHEGNILATHGHHFSLCNRQDSGGYGKNYPLGHFITRLAALYAQQLVKKGRYNNAGEMPGNGSPMDVVRKNVKKQLLIDECLKSPDLRVNLSDVLIYGIAKPLGLTYDSRFLGGEVYNDTTVKEVINKYKDMCSRYTDSVSNIIKFINDIIKYIKKFKIPVPDVLKFWDYEIAGFSLLACDYEEALFPFAYALREMNSSPVVIMGHTHHWIQHDWGLLPRGIDTNYTNSGYNCCPFISPPTDRDPLTCTIVFEYEEYRVEHLYDTCVYTPKKPINFDSPELDKLSKISIHKAF